MHYGSKAFGIVECETIQITLSGAALAAQKSRDGFYVKSAKVNGKRSWTKDNHALWLASNGVWIVGSTRDIGKRIGYLHSRVGSDLPYGNTDDWFYWNGKSLAAGGAWVNPKSEITVACTISETQNTIEPLVCNNSIF